MHYLAYIHKHSWEFYKANYKLDALSNTENKLLHFPWQRSEIKKLFLDRHHQTLICWSFPFLCRIIDINGEQVCVWPSSHPCQHQFSCFCFPTNLFAHAKKLLFWLPLPEDSAGWSNQIEMVKILSCCWKKKARQRFIPQDWAILIRAVFALLSKENGRARCERIIRRYGVESQFLVDFIVGQKIFF